MTDQPTAAWHTHARMLHIHAETTRAVQRCAAGDQQLAYQTLDQMLGDPNRAIGAVFSLTGIARAWASRTHISAPSVPPADMTPAVERFTAEVMHAAVIDDADTVTRLWLAEWEQPLTRVAAARALLRGVAQFCQEPGPSCVGGDGS